MTICSPAEVRSTLDMLRLQVDQREIRVAYCSAFTYAVQRNPQIKSGERELRPRYLSASRITRPTRSAVAEMMPFRPSWSIDGTSSGSPNGLRLAIGDVAVKSVRRLAVMRLTYPGVSFSSIPP